MDQPPQNKETATHNHTLSSHTGVPQPLPSDLSQGHRIHAVPLLHEPHGGLLHGEPAAPATLLDLLGAVPGAKRAQCAWAERSGGTWKRQALHHAHAEGVFKGAQKSLREMVQA